MSAKKSWDIVRNPAPARRPAPELVVTHFKRPSAPVRGGRPLRERRRAARRRFGVLLFILFIAVVGGAFWSLWQPWLRIGSVHAQGPYAETVPAVAGAASAGAWYGIVPRDSALFPPKARCAPPFFPLTRTLRPFRYGATALRGSPSRPSRARPHSYGAAS